MWKSIPGYQEDYEVSDDGQVWSNLSNHLMSQRPNKRGYLRVSLRCGPRYVHSLVSLAFLGPTPSGLEINHEDGDKSNNSLSNLKHVTHLENMQHATRYGLRRPARGEAHGSSKLSESAVLQIRELYASGQYNQSEIANKFGVSRGLVSMVVTGKCWAHLGTVLPPWSRSR